MARSVAGSRCTLAPVAIHPAPRTAAPTPAPRLRTVRTLPRESFPVDVGICGLESLFPAGVVAALSGANARVEDPGDLTAPPARTPGRCAVRRRCPARPRVFS